ncbi:unnamed protein product [Ostreobium quekettii]|uniref:Sec-independent protein translocase protein TatC n=1 Tax=Ostreobium quekettii TaxID=121088 RepID=A0A8S1IR01_9CHLO|nr:unnamed protein product [Ostreobium quekettii]|eukprot:evm.model.scf_1072.6 EVM.evm.TU.scf_1072.6   scf_1072:48665-52896(-)
MRLGRPATVRASGPRERALASCGTAGIVRRLRWAPLRRGGSRRAGRVAAPMRAVDGGERPQPDTPRAPPPMASQSADEPSPIEKFLNPSKDDLPDDFQMPVWDHLEELRERVLVATIACGVAVLTCFVFSKDLVVFLEAPVAAQGVRFLQLSPGEFFFTTFKVAGYAGLLAAAPTVIYEIVAYVIPGLTRSERKTLAPIVFGSSILFYVGLLFSYEILTPAALTFFVSYSSGAVESLWSIDQYFQFVLVLMLSTGLAFQVPVIQILLGQTGIVTSQMMFAQWRYVVVGATIAAAVLTPSTDPFTQTLLAAPLIALYMGGAAVVKALETSKQTQEA